MLLRGSSSISASRISLRKLDSQKSCTAHLPLFPHQGVNKFRCIYTHTALLEASSSSSIGVTSPRPHSLGNSNDLGGLTTCLVHSFSLHMETWKIGRSIISDLFATPGSEDCCWINKALRSVGQASAVELRILPPPQFWSPVSPKHRHRSTETDRRNRPDRRIRPARRDRRHVRVFGPEAKSFSFRVT